jgi:SP family arabinose:H+ symporter-like MFS transporter
VDVKGAVDSLKTANPARVARLTEELEAKKKTLDAATAVAASGAQPVKTVAETNLESVKDMASTALQQASKAAGSGGLMVLVCIFAFIASHAVGQGAVIWVFISEIFPNRHRAEGQALGSATHWVFAALLTTFFPLMIAALAPGYVFCIFSGMMVLQLVWVKFMMPETKGVPLEQMQKRLGIE